MLDQAGDIMNGLRTDAFGFFLEEGQAPFTVSVVPFGNMFFLCGVVPWNLIASVCAEPLMIIEDLYRTIGVADFNMLPNEAVGHTVVMLIG